MCGTLVSIVRFWTCSLSCFWYMCCVFGRLKKNTFHCFLKKKKNRGNYPLLDSAMMTTWERKHNVLWCYANLSVLLCWWNDHHLGPHARFQPSILSHNALDPRGGITTDKARLKEKWMINLVDWVGFKVGFYCKGKEHFLCGVPTSGLLVGKSQRRGKRIYRSCGRCWIKAINQNVKTVILGQTKSL